MSPAGLSAAGPSIERMFDMLSSGELLDEVERSQRDESVLMARRMAAVAELLWRRTEEAEGHCLDDPGYALITGFARTTAEVGAVLNLSPMAASRLISHAEALDTRLPAVARLLATGAVDWPTVQLVITRTELVAHDVIARLDERMAEQFAGWQCWSRRRVINAVDAAIGALDPDAAKERRVSADTARHVRVAAQPNGMAALRGSLPAPAAAIFDKRLSEMAMSVCKADSRTVAQRRADALQALGEGRELACDCGRSDCPAARSGEPANGPRFVVNVLAGGDTVTGHSDRPGYLEGYGVIDADQVRQLAEHATVRVLSRPAVDTRAAVRYQPGAALERWIRCRDLTCRFPGCDRPAWITDIDHTTPFDKARPAAGGLTVPSNLACYCRQHHRLKTFHCGPGGWRDTQQPDGTIVLTSPTGRIYRTTPAGADLFAEFAPARAEPEPRARNHHLQRQARHSLSRRTIDARRRENAETLRVNRARRREIDIRKWRNEVRYRLLLFKGRPSSSAYLTWVNEPPEPEAISADWKPPPYTPPPDDDEPPF